MARRKQDRFAVALEALKSLQDSGSCFAIKGANVLGEQNTRVLLENGFLETVLKGWYIPSTPSHAGTTVTWYACYWGFIAAYCNSRFGDDWTLTPEESLGVWSGANVIPDQVVVQAKKGSNSVQALKHGTSIFNFTTRLPETIARDPTYGLNVYPLEVALLRCTPDYFVNHSSEVRSCLNALEKGDALSSAVRQYGGDAYANRLIGALKAVGRADIAEFVGGVQSDAGRRVDPVNPFARDFAPVALPEPSPHAARIRLMWQEMRVRILGMLPEPEKESRSVEEILKEIDEGYVADSYHSLSIEGYKVSEELIRRVRDGEWNPVSNAGDHDQRNALAASGYYRAYLKVRGSVERILRGGDAGVILAAELEDWHRELFMPCVDAGLMTSADLAGYRRTQVYIAGSRYTPPSAAKVPDSMTAYLDLVRTEPDPRVRAILGHFFFVYIHPFADGNGRTARFVMNASLISAGFRWRIVPIERRDEYMKSLELASLKGDIEPFAGFVLNSAVPSSSKH